MFRSIIVCQGYKFVPVGVLVDTVVVDLDILYGLRPSRGKKRGDTGAKNTVSV